MANNHKGWADKPENRRKVRIVLYVACVLLVAADFVVHRHVGMAAEKVPAFYAWYGFISLVAVVLSAKVLRMIVKRREDYYDDAS